MDGTLVKSRPGKINEVDRYAVSVLRVTATIMIVICHVCSNWGSILGNVFDVGVYVFFIMSGMLFCGREINDSASWLKKRLIRIMIPVYINEIVLFVVACFYHNITLTGKQISLLFLNLQVFTPLPNGLALQHLWFVVCIMFCYLLTPLMVKKANRGIIQLGIIGVLGLLMFLGFCAFKNMFFQYFMGVVTYLVALIYGKEILRPSNTKSFSFITLAMFGGMMIRLFFKSFADQYNGFYGTLYDGLVIPFTHTLLATWIIVTVIGLCRLFYVHLYKLSRIVAYFDSVSYEIYITHYLFFVGVFRIMNGIKNFHVTFPAMCLGTLVFSLLLHKLSQPVIKKLNSMSGEVMHG